MVPVRAVMLDVDEGMLAARRLRGMDRRDEMWEGVLHMVPPPFERHQAIEAELVVALRAVARAHRLKVRSEVGVFAAADDYRVPDVVVYSAAVATERGVDGAPQLVVEVRSPGDETSEKVPWYLDRGARAVLVIDRDTLALELHTGEGRVPPEADGYVAVEALGVRIGPAAGAATLVVQTTDGAVELDL